jgi:CBS domain containing-hemolysin-like protein
MPWKPPGGTYAFAFPVLSFLGVAAATAGIARDLGVAVCLVLAEALAAFGAAAGIALERHSRSRVLDLASERGARGATEARLAHVPTHELTARLVRFLGNAVLVVGVAWLAFRDQFEGAHMETGDLPLATLGIVLAVIFVLTFLVNDVVVRLLTARRPNRALLRYLPTLQALRIALAPLRVPLVLIVRLLFRVDMDAAAPSPREEILETVEEGEREGSFTREEADMIESIIAMDASEAKDVLTPRADMVTIQADRALDEAFEIVRREGYSRLPVYGEDRDDVIGVLYAHDLIAYLGPPADMPTVKVRDLMRKPFFVPETKPINDLLREMRARKVHLAVVVDEFNGTTGLVTIEDLLEEIVGEIEDEYDVPDEGPAPGPEPTAAGTLRVEGRTPIEEVNRALELSLPIEEDFETMSGLVFHLMGKIPDAGEQLELNGVRVTVLETDERTISKLEVEVLPGGATASATSGDASDAR